MSVLKKDRHDSQIKYVYDAWKLEVEVYTFLTKVSAKINRVLGPTLLELSSQLSTLTTEASEIYRKRLTQENFIMHHNKLLEAFAKAQALDSKLNIAYLVMSRNACGVFEKKNLSEKDSATKIDKEAAKLGEMMAEVIDELEVELEGAKASVLNKEWLHLQSSNDTLL